MGDVSGTPTPINAIASNVAMGIYNQWQKGVFPFQTHQVANRTL